MFLASLRAPTHLEQYFPTAAYSVSEYQIHNSRSKPMARLFSGEKKWKRQDILRALRCFEQGLTESEIAEILRWDRRTVNNYLRELENNEQVYKEGRMWFSEEPD